MSKSNDLGRYGTAAKEDKATSGTPTSGLVDAALGFWGAGVEFISTQTALNAGDYIVPGVKVMTPPMDTCTSIPLDWDGTSNRALIHTVGASGTGILQILARRQTSGNAQRLWFRAGTTLLADGSDWVQLYHTGNNIDARVYGVGSSITSKVIDWDTEFDGDPNQLSTFLSNSGSVNGPVGTFYYPQVFSYLPTTADNKCVVAWPYGAGGSNSPHFRTRYNSIWSEWNKIYHTGNAVSSVASGGIIETGTNANGTYTKFADGTMICTKFAGTVNTGFFIQTWSAAFINNNYRAVATVASSASDTIINCKLNTYTASSVYLAAVGISQAGVGLGFLAVNVDLIAIGRWKA